MNPCFQVKDADDQSVLATDLLGSPGLVTLPHFSHAKSKFPYGANGNSPEPFQARRKGNIKATLCTPGSYELACPFSCPIPSSELMIPYW